MTTVSPAASIIVPCRNERDHIELSIRSILQLEAPAGGFEVIVADGMSDDGTREILERLAVEDSRLRIIDNPRQIVSTALNEGIKAAAADIIIRMDAHTQYAPDYVLRCIETMTKTRADNVGGPWMAKGHGLIGGAIAAAFQSGFAMGGAKGHDPAYEGIVDTVYLGCWRREVFARIGLFDEELIRNQDDEFNLRLTRAGGKVWQSPGIRSWYCPRGSLRALFKQYRQYGYWKVRVIQKHKIPASFRHLVPGSFVFLVVVLPLVGLWSRPALWIWLVTTGMYSVANFGASLLTALRTKRRFFPVLPVVFACYHLGYGYGFLRGLCDFVLLRRQPHEAYVQLTRPSSDARQLHKSELQK